MTWLSKIARRFREHDKIRYFTEGRRGKGKGIVLSPNFSKGTVTGFDPESRRYKVQDIGSNELIDVHPRNLVHDTFNTPVPSSNPITDPLTQNGV